MAEPSGHVTFGKPVTSEEMKSPMLAQGSKGRGSAGRAWGRARNTEF